MTAIGTGETVHSHDWDVFVTLMLLENYSCCWTIDPVLSLRLLCQELGNFHVWQRSEPLSWTDDGDMVRRKVGEPRADDDVDWGGARAFFRGSRCRVGVDVYRRRSLKRCGGPCVGKDTKTIMADSRSWCGRSEGFPRTRITKRSCACDCGRGRVSVGAFFFLSFFFLLSCLTQGRALKLRFVLEKAMFWAGPGRALGRHRGGKWQKNENKMKKWKQWKNWKNRKKTIFKCCKKWKMEKKKKEKMKERKKTKANPAIARVTVWNHGGVQVQGFSTWSKCGRDKETAFTHRQLGERRQEWKAQLDHIIGPRWRSDEAYIYNDVTIRDGWDHYPMTRRYNKMKSRSISLRGKQKRNGPDGGQKLTRKKMNSGWGVEMRSWTRIWGQYRKLLRMPLEKWHIVRKTKEKNCETNSGERENTWRSRSQVHKSDQEKSAQETSEESQSGTPG